MCTPCCVEETFILLLLIVGAGGEDHAWRWSFCSRAKQFCFIKMSDKGHLYIMTNCAALTEVE